MSRILSGLALACGLGLSAPTASLAAPGLTKQVYSPYVKNGVTEVEVRGGRLNGGPLDGESGMVVELERGFGDRFSLAILGEIKHHAGRETKLDAVAVEGLVYLGQIPGTGVDVGGYLEYEQRIHNESGVLEAKLLLARQVGPVHARLNLIGSQPLTDRKGEGDAEYEYAAQGAVDLSNGFQAGLQAFGELGTSRTLGGRLAHYMGPMVRWETKPDWLKAELEFEAAYLLPLAAARDDADSQFRFALEIERRF